MAVAKRPARDAAEATVPARVSRRRRRMVMRLRIMRSLTGNSLGAESDALAAGTGGGGGAEAAASAMDDKLKVCSDLPNDVLCKILLLVGMPVAKSFQLQLVNRQWRQVLTSADFRHERQQQSRRDDMLVACIPLGRRSLALAATGRNSKQSPAARVVDIDLSFLPDGFWSSQPSSYAVVAVGGGLVCVSDAKGCLSSAERLCVLNPLTRTCKAVPPVPLPQTGASGVEVTHLHAGALTVLLDTVACRSGPRLRDWVLATYDLEAARPGGGNRHGGQWTVVRALPGLAAWSHPVSTRHLVACGGKIYLYHKRKVYMHAASPAAGAGDAFVETEEVAVPATPSLGKDPPDWYHGQLCLQHES